jgi:hypothetical protein
MKARLASSPRQTRSREPHPPHLHLELEELLIEVVDGGGLG